MYKNLLFRLLLLLFFAFFLVEVKAQNHLWSANIGGSSEDLGRWIYTDNNGFVYVGGYLSSSNVDFDPSPTATFFLSSNGDRDGYISKYTANGQFVWAFKIGGGQRDEVNAVTVDPSGNIYATGYFRGSGVDFDPSATRTAILNSNGDNGGDPGYGGDIFVAKYNSQGQYVWAFNIGAAHLADNGMTISSDNSGNVYLAGYFEDVVDFDPSAGGISNINSSDGRIFVAKYNTSGQYQWAFPLGGSNTDSAPFGMKADGSGNIYLTGYFQQSNRDFDPSPTGTAYLSSNGGFDIYAAKYNSAGQYQWAFGIGGSGTDVGRDIEIDNLGNVYVVGDFQGSNIDFNPSPTATANLSSNNRDVFIAKYNPAGQYQWARRFGGGGTDISWSVAYTDNHVYITGSFQGVMNFNPGPVSDNLVSKGANDFYMTKFDVNGNYVCAFSVGGAGDDDAYRLVADNNKNLYTTGILSSTNTDFNPSSGSNTLSSNGSSDAFIAKYIWPDNPKPAGTLSGSTVCPGGQGTLTFNSTAGTGPFILEYSNGTTTITQTNVQSGVAFNVSPNPTTTTNYSLVSIRDATVCPSTNNVSGITAIINVGNCQASFTAPDTVCVNAPVNITNTSGGASNHYWSFCSANFNTSPLGTNIGNFGFSSSVFIDFAFENNNYYGFVTNNNPGKLVRLDFGNSLLNTPTATDLGDLGGVVPLYSEGIQLVKNEGRWYAIIVGGNPGGRIVKLDFGTALTSTPVATNWGNIGNLGYPVDLHVFRDGSNWYGFTINSINNTITRFDFTNSFNNTPTAVNLGNLGNLNYPTGIYAIKNNNNWNVFITNAGSPGSSSPNSSLTRLDFGNSLLNTPTGINIGNPGNTLSSPRDIVIYQSCNEIFAYVVNYSSTNDIVKLDFNNNLTAIPSAVSLGNIGNLSFPHCISKFYRVNNDLYSFIVNVDNNTLSRLRLPGCTNSSIPNSTLQNPPTVTYNSPGTYNITLVTDEGLNTQSSFCKQVVVLPPVVFQPMRDTTICSGHSVMLNANAQGATTYSWSPTTGLSNPNISNPIASPTVTTRYIVTASGPGICSAKDTVLVTVVPGISADFTYVQNTCSPKTVQFFAVAAAGTTYSWDFGDGTTSTGSPNPIVTYANYGTYTIKLVVKNAGGCTDSIVKSMPVMVTLANTILTSDTTICAGTTLRLATDSGVNYCWKPDPSINNPNIANTTITPTANTTYFFTSLIRGTNLVANGDFTAGNTGFTSDYVSAFPNSTEGQYWVNNNPSSWNGGMSNCPDHTNGTGNMMMVNGSPVQGAKVWSQTVAINPNTNYAFSVWIQSLHATNPASLRFSINGRVLGNNINAGNTTCSWKQFYITWNSGTATSGAISIVNNNTIQVGNDFAIDDISFSPVTIRSDSLNVNIAPPLQIKTINDTTICKGSSVQLTTTGGNVYSWSPAKGLSDSAIASPIATPDVTTTYIVSGYLQPGCIGKDTVKITVSPIPLVSVTKDTTICSGTPLQLNATGGSTYQWSPATGLSSTTIANPISTVSSTIKYFVTVTTGAGCSKTDSVTVTVVPKANTKSINDTAMCKGASVTLTTTGANVYSWTPATGLSATNVSSPVATPASTTTYIVSGHISTGCVVKDTIVITVNPIPVVSVTKDTTICSGTPLQLNATGGGTYQWSPATGLSSTTIANPISTVISTIKYFVAVTTAAGCSKRDSVTITVVPRANTKTIKDTAICKGSSVTLTTTGANVYSWTPATGLSATNVSSPIATPTSTTTYIVSGYLAPGCVVKDTVNVIVNAIPVVSVTKDTSICAGASLQLNATGGGTYSWTPATDLSATTIANPVATPVTDIIYYVTVLNTGRCSKTDSVSIKVVPKPDISSIKDTAICFGSSVTLTTVGGNVFSWTPPTGLSSTTISNPVATPTVTTTYIVSGYMQKGCAAIDSVTVTIKPRPITTITNDTTICAGKTLQLNATGGTGYQWSPITGLSSTTIANPVSSATSDIVYKVVVTSPNGCSSTDSVKVKVLSNPVIKMRSDTTVCKGSSVILNTSLTGATSFTWSPTATLSNATSTSPKATPTDTTRYILTATNSGCISKDSVRINVLAVPVTKVTPDTFACSGKSVQLIASGGSTYQWTPIKGLSSANINNPIATPDTTTKYYVTATGSNGCSKKDSVVVTINATPVVKTIANISACQGSPVILNTTSSGGAIYQWSPKIGLNDSTILSPLATPAVTTKYVITVFSNKNCFSKDSVTVSVLSNPVITKSKDTTICNGAGAQIFATGGVSYLWTPSTGLSSTSISNPNANPASTTTYHVAVAGANGCIKTDSIKIDVRAGRGFKIEPAIADLCIHDSINLTASGGDSYLWFAGNNMSTPGSPSTMATPTTTTTYKVQIKDTVCRIIDTLSTLIRVHNLPAIALRKSNDVDCTYPSAQLTATGGKSYEWLPHATLNNPYISNPVSTPGSTTNYIVKVSDGYGCVNTDSIKVLVSFTSGKNLYEIPNAFTPNNDGRNDCFGIKLWGVLEKFDFSIFNRWGQVIFHTNNPTECWDGKHKGIVQETGTFVYVLKATSPCVGDINRKGTVVLIR